MASSTTPTRRTSAGWTFSGACTSGSTARHSVATRPASGGAATTSTTASCKSQHEIDRFYNKYPGEQAILNVNFEIKLVKFCPFSFDRRFSHHRENSCSQNKRNTPTTQ